MTSVDPDRRPLASRNLAISHRIANWLIRRSVSPNGISVGGMVFGGIAGAAFAGIDLLPAWAPLLWFVGGLFVQLRLLANLLDGMVAIGGGARSALGELYNEVPDRISDTVILIGVGVAAQGNWPLGLVAAFCAMATAYIRVFGKAAGLAYDFSGPMAKPHRMFLVTVLAVVCALGGIVAPDSELLRLAPGAVLVAISVLAAVTALRRVAHVAGGLRGHGA